MKVTISKLNHDAEDEEVGTIRLENGRLVCEPSDVMMLQRIARTPILIYDGATFRKIDPDTPEEFLSNLHRNYRGSYVRATEAEE